MGKSTTSFSNYLLKFSSKYLKCLALLALLLSTNSLFSANKYVTLGGLGSKNGSSWSNALDGTGNNIKTIIETAASGDNIFIAGGVYTISTTILWKTSVNIYGGFSNINPETSLSNREHGVAPQFPWVFPTNSTTVISGSSSITGRIVTQSCGATGIIDGITFQNGQSGNESVGGALYISKGKVVNCIIKNSFSNNGGGIYIGSEAELINSLVFNNTTNASGLKCTYDGGGGVYIDNGGKITNCYVTNNRSFNNGGGIFFNRGGVATNCVINNNYASSGGGAFMEYGGTLINCTVVNNAVPAGSSTRGKGVYYNIYSSSADVNIKNSVIWNNSGYGKDCASNGNIGTIKNCAGTFQPAAGTTCFALSADNLSGTKPPKFTTPTSAAGYISTMTQSSVGDWSITTGSSLVDVGSNSYNSLPLDIIGNNRFYGTIDIGAYELGTIEVSSIVISNNVYTYDGNSKGVTVAITPSNVTGCLVEYKQGSGNYSTTQPINVGVYDVRVTITQAGYSGVKTGTLTINKANVTGLSFSGGIFVFDNTIKTLVLTGNIPNGVTVSYANNAKIDAGTYSVTATIKNGGTNYNNSTITGNLVITPKPVVISITPSSKFYGNVDPIPTYTSNVVVANFGGSFSGSLSRTVGEIVGNYPYSIGSLSLGNNFSIVINPCALTILPKPISVSVSSLSKPYDGTINSVLPTLTLQQGSGVNQVLVNDFSDVTVSAVSANYDTKAVGVNKVVTVNGITLSGAKAHNYTISNSATNTVSSISSIPLSVSGLRVEDKVYDGTDLATLSGNSSLNGVIQGDVVTLINSSVNKFVSSNAGNHIEVTTQFNLSGVDAINYNLIQPQLSGVISPATLSVTFPSVSKVYDGTNQITPIPTLTVVGAKNSESITASASNAVFDNKNVGTGKLVTINGVSFISPNNSNYILASTASNNLGVILPRNIITSCIVTFPAVTKVYDGNTSVSQIDPSKFNIQGLFIGDQIQVANYGTAAYDNKNAGDNKVVTVSSLTYSGGDAANYVLPQTAINTNCVITKRDVTADPNLSISFATQTKVFDGTTKVLPDSTNTPIIIHGLIANDVVTANASEAYYDNEHVGINKVITLDGIVYSGVDALNYLLPTSVSESHSSITAREISTLPNFTITFDNQTKVYDGTTIVKPIAIPAITINGLLPGSTVIATGSAASYDNKNVGENKIVTISNVVYSGKDAKNYILPSIVTNSTSSITKRSIVDDPSLSVVFGNQTKIFDGTTAVLPNGANTPINILGLIVNDLVTANATNAYYDNANVGTNKTVTLDGITYHGADAGNYDLPQLVQNSNSSITPLDISTLTNAKIYIADQTKVYDGTTEVKPKAIPDVYITGLLDGSVVLANGSYASYDNKRVGTNKVVTVGGLIFSGKDAQNYTFPTFIQNLNSSITKRSVVDDSNLTVTFSDQSKVFDGTIKVLPDSTKTKIYVNGLIAGDQVIASASTATYDNPNVGTAKTVQLAGILYSGVDADNYLLPDEIFNHNCEITPFDISYSNVHLFIDNQTKVYDGTTEVKPQAIPNVKIAGLLPGTELFATGSSASYDNKNVGNNKVVTVRGISYSGKDASNYSLPDSVQNTYSSIIKRSVSNGLTISIDAQTKLFDGTTKVLPDSTATPIHVGGLIAGDQLFARATAASYDNENAGTNKTVTLSGIVFSGADAGNYELPTVVVNNRSAISPLSVTLLPNFNITIANQTKVYDGTTVVKPIAVPAITLTGLLPGSLVTAAGSSASYDNKNVGENKVVTVSNVTYTGKDAQNYIFPTTVVNSASSITKLSVVEKSDLGLSIDAQTKLFDGTTKVLPDSTATPIHVGGLIAGDQLFARATAASYDNENAGTNKTVTLSGIVFSGADAGNYELPTVVVNNRSAISPLSVTLLPNFNITIANQTKVYDGTTVVKPIAVPAITLTGLLPGSVVTAAGSSASYDNKNVGENKVVTVSNVNYTGKDAQNYIFPTTVVNSASSITKLSVVEKSDLGLSIDAQTKLFDGTTKVLPDSTATPIHVGGLIAGDQLFARATAASYDNENAGTNKTVTLSGIVFSGADAGNYELPTVVVNNRSAISPLSVTLLPNFNITIANQTKVYDGTTVVKPIAVPAITLTGLLPGSVVTAAGSSASYDNKNVGENKVVTVSNVNYTGKDAQNYIFPTTVVNSASSITKLSVVEKSDLGLSIDAQTKLFDGTTKVLPDSTATPIHVGGLIAGDQLFARATAASYDNENAGTNKTVTLSGIVFSGADAGNYELPTVVVNNRSAISPLSVTLLPNFNITIANQTKVYDGTTVVKPIAVPAITLTGLLPGSVVTAAGSSASYDNKNVGENKVVTVSNVTYTGKDAQNYIFPTTVVNSASSITKLSVVEKSDLGLSIDAQTKLFDGTTKVLPDSTATPIHVGGLIAGDQLFARATAASYDNENAGTNKTVTLSGIVFSGADAGNYELPTVVVNNRSAISPLSVTLLPNFNITIDNQTKVYDGTTVVKPIAVPAITLTGLLPGSVVTAAGSSASYDNKNVGENKVVTVSNVTYTGKDAQNYIFPTSINNSSSSITKLTLNEGISLSFDAQSKIYDKTVDVLNSDRVRFIPSVIISGILPDDIVVAQGTSAYYDSPSVGFNKSITISGIVYSGVDCLNYDLPTSITSTNHSILPLQLKKLDLQSTKISKIYDGTRDVLVMPKPEIDGVLLGEDVTFRYSSALFDDENVGRNKGVSLELEAIGKDAVNYNFDSRVRLINCEILPYPVKIVPVAGQKRAYEDSEGVLEYQRVVLPLNGVPLKGMLTRDPGTDPGKYVIRIGELNQINQNYDVTLDGNVVYYEITTDLIVNKKYGNSLYAYNGTDLFVSYQWYKDNTLIPNATSQYYRNSDLSLCGEYFCEAIKTNGARVRSYRYVETVNCNGVKKYSLYPTLLDLNGKIKISLDSQTNEYVFDNILDATTYKVQIYSMAGDLVLEYVLDSIVDATVVAPNSSGIYIVKLLQEDSIVLSQKITVK